MVHSKWHHFVWGLGIQTRPALNKNRLLRQLVLGSVQQSHHVVPKLVHPENMELIAQGCTQKRANARNLNKQFLSLLLTLDPRHVCNLRLLG